MPSRQACEVRARRCDRMFGMGCVWVRIRAQWGGGRSAAHPAGEEEASQDAKAHDRHRGHQQHKSGCLAPQLEPGLHGLAGLWIVAG